MIKDPDKKEDRREHRLDKLDAKSQKALAVAAKRKALGSVLKWLVILIIVGFLVFKFGGFSLKNLKAGEMESFFLGETDGNHQEFFSSAEE
jgi:hypothetical protein